MTKYQAMPVYDGEAGPGTAPQDAYEEVVGYCVVSQEGKRFRQVFGQMREREAESAAEVLNDVKPDPNDPWTWRVFDYRGDGVRFLVRYADRGEWTAWNLSYTDSPAQVERGNLTWTCIDAWVRSRVQRGEVAA